MAPALVRPRQVAVLTAMVSPSIAGISLVVERGGWELLGFDIRVGRIRRLEALAA